MPELPEVQTICDDIKPFLIHKKIIKIEVFDPMAITGINHRGLAAQPFSIQNFKRAVQNKTIKNLQHRGKYLIASLDGAEAIIFHLRMTGQLLMHANPPKKARLILHLIDAELSSRATLYFYDARRFGSAIYSANWQKENSIANLGAEPLSKQLTAEYLKKYFAERRASIHSVLLDQTVVTGIGNIYAAESLFYAKISPFAPAGKLSLVKISALIKAIKKVLKESIATRGHSMNSYVDAFGQRGSTQNFAAVYGRQNRACKICGTILKKATLSGRSVVYCKNCQK